MSDLFDRLIDRRGTDCIKWDAYDDGVIPMGIADMDFASPEAVKLALLERAAHGIYGYPESLLGGPDEATEMRQVIVERLARLYGWVIQPEEIVFLPGVHAAFNLACHALALEPQGLAEGSASPGAGAVLVQPPVYPPFLKAPGFAGMDRQDAQLTRRPDGSYEVDFDAFEAAITPQTRLFMLCNPHNPVGRVFQPGELERMAEICLRRGVVICSDEIHCDLLYSGQRHTPIASLDPEIASQTITLMAPSKAFNLAGLKFSFSIIQNPALRRQYRKAERGLVGWINIMGWVAARAAYREGQSWLDQLLVYLEGNRDYLYDFVRNELPGISMAKPEGTYLAWLDCREAAGAMQERCPSDFFLEKARVALNDGATFGSGGEGFARLNFGCPRSVLAEALERMKHALGHP